MTRREGILIRVFSAWTVWVWATRIGNVMGEHGRSVGFKVVHVTLAVISVALAVCAWIVVRRARRRAAVGPR